MAKCSETYGAKGTEEIATLQLTRGNAWMHPIRAEAALG